MRKTCRNNVLLYVQGRKSTVCQSVNQFDDNVKYRSSLVQSLIKMFLHLILKAKQMINYWSKEVITLLIYWFVVWLVGWLVCLLVKKKECGLSGTDQNSFL